MKKYIVVILLCLGMEAVAGPITMDQARKIALGRVPGKVMHEKLKKANKDDRKKDPNAHDHYNVKILPATPNKGKWKKVEIDAVTGVVLEIKDVKPKSYDE